MDGNEIIKSVEEKIKCLKLQRCECLELCNDYDVHYARYMYFTGLIEAYCSCLKYLYSYYRKEVK